MSCMALEGIRKLELMQNPSERATAENVRMLLRNGFQRMLSNMQKQREEEPAALTATAEELRKLTKVKPEG